MNTDEIKPGYPVAGVLVAVKWCERAMVLCSRRPRAVDVETGKITAAACLAECRIVLQSCLVFSCLLNDNDGKNEVWTTFFGTSVLRGRAESPSKLASSQTFSNPVCATGDWPDIVKDTLPSEYLPRFTDQEKRDFFAIDSYRSQWPVCNEPVLFDSDYGWAIGPAADPLATWLQATPVTVRTLLKDLHSRWPSNTLYVSEFGFAEPFENEKTDLSQIKEDVDRATMLDNAEWASGTSVRFGIQHVNYTTLERTYKRSVLSLDLRVKIAEFFASHLQD
ncbi:glycoside hydrolase superfamily [Desarmillaria tabescens]|uniref:Glycoside hydrolase superfamily n=1 Tax=Armillaria tabescens TaxID=1929756 RepID=A0AA39MR96_ARMTA|nr:glycoside hydrolase superfamily [Desarmillaria tabescens]KAK0443328.1 glycoside hydrolase superfamily [Desarmillaria tabescens]